MQKIKFILPFVSIILSLFTFTELYAEKNLQKPYELKNGKSVTDFYFTNLSDDRIKQITIVFSAFDSDGICAFENETVSFILEINTDSFKETRLHISEEDISEESGFSGNLNSLITDYAWISEIVYEDGKTFRDPLGRFAE